MIFNLFSFNHIIRLIIHPGVIMAHSIYFPLQLLLRSNSSCRWTSSSASTVVCKSSTRYDHEWIFPLVKATKFPRETFLNPKLGKQPSAASWSMASDGEKILRSLRLWFIDKLHRRWQLYMQPFFKSGSCRFINLLPWSSTDCWNSACCSSKLLLSIISCVLFSNLAPFDAKESRR